MSTTSFTQRTGGVSTGVFTSLNLGLHVGDEVEAVTRNRQKVADLYGATQYMTQVHGDQIAIVEEPGEDIEGVDALVTGVPGITLAVLVADCIPLLIRSECAVAAVHVGRRGLVNGLTSRVIEVMKQMGAASLTATIGPYICGLCYEVSQELATEVVSVFPEASSRTRINTPALDIGAGLRSDLEKHKIIIDDRSICTYESKELFSFRRDGKTGRQAGLISL